ncbi:MAG: TolC family protein [Candidatus Omnitrophica bacterium]|nr:TolC family protein [Candidatus Omnitrophota bacterium]
MKLQAFRIVLIILMSIAAAVPASAQNVLHLSLEEVTEVALQNNFDIQLAKYESWIKKTDEMQVKSIFDTIFDAEVRYQDDQSARASTVFGTQTRDNDYNLGVSKLLPTGTDVRLYMTNERDATNSQFSTAPVTHDSTLGVSVEQALGKNFFGLQDRGQVQITQIDIQNSRFTSLDRIEQAVAEVQRAYWDLVLQRKRVEIEKDMLEQAQKLYELQQRKLNDGLVELPDAIAAEANFEAAKNRLRLAQNSYDSRVNVLKLLINRTDLEITIEPTVKLRLPKEDQATIASLGRAFKNRRDYLSALNDARSRDIQVTISRNGLLPEINLIASLERNGLGDHFSDSAKAISESDNPNLFAGLRVVYPLENRRARAELKAAELEKARVLLNTKYIEKTISIDIVDQVRDCNVLAEVARNEAQISDLQIKKLEEEQKRFNRGRSSTDIIIRFQEDVIQARLSAAEAIYRYHLALIELQRREATLLAEYWTEDL